MKSLKISLALLFALLLCTSCIGNGNKNNETDPPDTTDTMPEDTVRETDTDNMTENESDNAPAGNVETDTGNETETTDTDMDKRTSRMRAHAREHAEELVAQIQHAAEAYLR